MKRREFVKTTGAAVATGLVVAGCGNDVVPAPVLPEPIMVNSAGELLVAIKTTDGQDHYPDLTPVGGAITIPVGAPAGMTGLPDAILLVHLSDEKTDPLRYAAMNSSCPHAACPLGFSTKDFMVECPCHGSKFAISEGAMGCATVEVNHLPAPSPPVAYAVQVSPDGNLVTISLNAGASFKFADHPELKNAGGVAISSCPPVVVVNKDGTNFAAYSAVCTHLSCLVGTTGTNIACPCHGSTFDPQTGAPITGPATRPLPMLKATPTADGIDVS